MENHGGQEKLEAILRSLYPEASDDDLREAEANLKKYVSVMLDIYERHMQCRTNGDSIEASLTDRP